MMSDTQLRQLEGGPNTILLKLLVQLVLCLVLSKISTLKSFKTSSISTSHGVVLKKMPEPQLGGPYTILLKLKVQLVLCLVLSKISTLKSFKTSSISTSHGVVLKKMPEL